MILLRNNKFAMVGLRYFCVLLLIEYQIYPISKSHVSKKIKEEMPKFIERRDFYRQCIKDAMLKFNK